MTYYSSFYPIESSAGQKGSAAFLGAISTAIVYLYRRSATALVDADKPNGSVIYTFATGNTNITAVTNGWSVSIPSGTDPIYIVGATATSTDSTDTILTNEWTSPAVLAQNGTNGISGTNGLNSATIFLYQRSNSSTPPTAPSTTTTYTFATGVLTGTLGSWTQTAPDSSTGKYLFYTTATAIANTATDTIANTEWSTVKVLVENGAIGYTTYLTNESHNVPASSAGVVSAYTGASGSFIIYKEGVGDISSNFTLSTVSNPQTLTVNYTTNTYTVTGGLDAGESVATLTIRATGTGTYTGLSFDKVFTLGKSSAGVDGSPAKLLSVSASRFIITYDGSGNLNPSVQTTTFTASKQNTSNSVSWTITDTAGNNLTPVTTYLSSASGDSVSMTAAQFAAAISVNGAQGVIVTATVTDGVTLTDKVTVVKVANGATGATGPTGAGGLVIDLSQDSCVVPANSDGSSPILTTAVTTLKVYEGGTDVTGSWSLSATPGSGVTGTFSTGVYTVTNLTVDSSYVDFTATRVGYPTLTIRFNIAKAKAGANGTPATFYEVIPNSSAIRRTTTGTYQPTSVTFSGFSTTGNGARAAYSGRFIIATSTDGTSYTNVYTSAANETSASYTIQPGILYVRGTLYAAGGTTTLLDSEEVPIVIDGATGADGAAGSSAITGMLTAEAVGVFTYADGTPVSFSNAKGNLKVYLGTNEVTASCTGFSVTLNGCTGTVNTADNTPVAGQLKGYYQVTAIAGDTASMTISATYGSTTISKIFNISKVKAGYEIVDTLPATNLFEGRTVYLTTDNKLYRYDGTAWIKDIDAGDITAGNIAAARMQTNVLNALQANVSQLSAITAIIGTLRTATSGARTEIQDNLITVYDSNGVLRVRMGVW